MSVKAADHSLRVIQTMVGAALLLIVFKCTLKREKTPTLTKSCPHLDPV